MVQVFSGVDEFVERENFCKAAETHSIHMNGR